MEYDCRFRCMTRADIGAVLELERRCHPHPWSREIFLRELDNPLATIELMLIDEHLVGYLVGWLVADELEIQNLVTAPEWRRRGLAGRLLRRALSHAAVHRSRRAVLEVRAGNASAIALYQAFGFTIDAHRKHYYHDGETALLMSLDDLSGFDLPAEPVSPARSDDEEF